LSIKAPIAHAEYIEQQIKLFRGYQEIFASRARMKADDKVSNETLTLICSGLADLFEEVKKMNTVA
jgi:hypothetical protein